MVLNSNKRDENLLITTNLLEILDNIKHREKKYVLLKYSR